MKAHLTVFVGPNGEDLSAYADGGDYTYDFNTAQGVFTIEGYGAYIGIGTKDRERRQLHSCGIQNLHRAQHGNRC